MTLTHWKPFRDLMPMYNSMNRFFDDEFIKEFDHSNFNQSMTGWNPAADVMENKDEYILKLEVFGVAREDINIEFHDNTLTIKGERKADSDLKEEDIHRIERFSGNFSRNFTLPGETDSEKIEAKLKDGILELRIPKAEEKKAKSIPINL
jgi:HSP20 family protein